MSAKHVRLLPDDFLDRFSLTGSPDRVVVRLHQLAALGVERFTLVPASRDADPHLVADPYLVAESNRRWRVRCSHTWVNRLRQPDRGQPEFSIRLTTRASSNRLDVLVFLSRLEMWDDTVFSLITNALAISE